MSDGCYDIDGKCVNCGQYHPCACEVEDVTAQSPRCPLCGTPDCPGDCLPGLEQELEAERQQDFFESENEEVTQ